MTRAEIKGLAEGMAPVVRMYFAQAIAPLTARMDALERKLGDPALVRTMTPPHPYLSARPLAVDSEYSVPDAIQADNVTLVTDGIQQITDTAIRTVTGEHHDVDVIVYATGFHATDYLFPMSIVGRGGSSSAFSSAGSNIT